MRAFVFGDNIDTDVLAPGHLMKLPAADLARHCLEAVDPAFASTVKSGDVVFAGRNFGLGSSREQAAISLKVLGLAAIFAPSFARIFYRNAINIGLPALTFDPAGFVETGDEVTVDFAAGVVTNLKTARSARFSPLPPDLQAIIDAGGLMPLLERRFRPSA